MAETDEAQKDAVWDGAAMVLSAFIKGPYEIGKEGEGEHVTEFPGKGAERVAAEHGV